jgi:hypothetical protein
MEADAEAARFVFRWSRSEHHRALSDPDHAHLVLIDKGRLVGFLLLAGWTTTAPNERMNVPALSAKACSDRSSLRSARLHPGRRSSLRARAAHSSSPNAGGGNGVQNRVGCRRAPSGSRSRVWRGAGLLADGQEACRETEAGPCRERPGADPMIDATVLAGRSVFEIVRREALLARGYDAAEPRRAGRPGGAMRNGRYEISRSGACVVCGSDARRGRSVPGR